MAAAHSDRLRIIERALRAVYNGALKGESADEVIARAAANIDELDFTFTKSEKTKADSVLLVRLWCEAGADREAAGKVARSLTDCPHARVIYAQRIRRLVREQRN